MIWLSRREELKRLIYTLISRNLEFIGVFKFFVREKRIVKLNEAEIQQFCLFLSTETDEYGGTVTVPRKRYDQARLEESYGLCGVIRNIKHTDFIFITENTNPDTAIKQAVRKSWAKLFFILIVLGLCLGTGLIFLYALLHLSWS